MTRNIWGCNIITEKAIRDFAWCPTLFLEAPGNAKRFKKDRTYEDDTLEEVQRALSTSVSNKKAIITQSSPLSTKAEPYSEEFWLVINSGDSQVLLSVQEFRLEKEPAGPWTIIARRKQPKKPQGVEALQFEENARALIAGELKEYFPRAKVKVETKYETEVQPLVTIDPSTEQVGRADEMIEEIRQANEGEKTLKANTDRCFICWWRKECPAAINISGQGPSTGKPKRSFL